MFFNDVDVDDHTAVIGWVSRQPWCDGNVVLFGTSYYAVVQPAVATRNPPALRGFFAYGTDTDYFSQIAMFGGAPQADFLTLWLGANFTVAQERLHVPAVVRAALSQVVNSRLKRIWAPLLNRRMARLMNRFKRKTPAAKYRQMLAEWLYDGKTRATHTIPPGPRGVLDKIDVPFVVVNDVGAFNLHQYGAYEILQKASTPRDRQWLILTPPEYALPVHRWQLEAVAFFDHIIHAADNGYAAQPRVRYSCSGRTDGDYRGASDFPIPGAQKYRLFPSGSRPDRATHRLVAVAPAAGANSWAATPFGAVVPPGMDEVATPSLAFECMIDEPTELVGPIHASLCFSCSEIDSHVILRVARIGADETLHHLAMGSIRPAYRQIDSSRTFDIETVHDFDHPEPLIPGTAVILQLSLPPFPVLLTTGEKLRIDIGSRTDLLRNNVSHGYERFDMVVPPYFSRNTIHYGADTWIEFDRIPSNNPSST